MLIPLGFLAASGVSAGSFDLLETQVLGSSTASVTFSSLSTYAATYQHLQIRAVVGGTDGSDNRMWLRLNGVTTGYSWHNLFGNGSSVSSQAGTSTTSIRCMTSISDGTASQFSGVVIDLLDVFETTKNKTVRTLGGGISTSDTRIALTSGLYASTDAVSSIALAPGNTGYGAGNFKSGSRFSLYGIKAA
jgi:hypothetical protein